MAGGGDELKLLATWFSPFASRVKFVFHLKGLSYENIEEDLKNKSELLLKSNPVIKKVPVLLHNGKPLCESMVIVEYLDETFAGVGPSVVPADPYERAVARFWVSYIDNKVFRSKSMEEKAEGLKQIFVAVMVLEEAFKECSKGKPFFGGDNAGVVDIALGSQLGWVRASQALSGIKLFDPAKTPLLAAWAERFLALDAAKASMPEFGRLIEYAKMRQADKMAVRDNHELKLLGTWPSPFVVRVRLALGLKGLSYEYVEQDIRDKSELLVVSNPVHKKVPVLIHGGKPVCESQIIVQYIDEAFLGAGASLLPSDPHERAVARFWAAYIDDEFATKFRAMGEAKEEEEKGEAAAQVFAALETLEEAMKACCSKGKVFFGGDSAGYVDVALGGFLGWIKAAEALAGVAFLDGARTPLLAAWAVRFSSLEAAKEAIPSVERLREFHVAMHAAAATVAGN
uniref:glutathione transferase n=1 Tax=Oryza meridionalis TaxID=40149 RepID=A0A0E0F087_9ORYZ